MIPLWYGILAFMLAIYVALDGRNFGTGALHWIVAKSCSERRQVIAAIGPLWTWHEVWLLGTGGVMIMAFPKFMAAAFSGYYLALFLVLWCILLRGISIEVGGHIQEPLWQSFWDAVFMFNSVLLAILFGTAFGNVIRGVPIKSDGTFYLTFFTNFRVRDHVGLLDWYTVTIGVFILLLLTAHGANYLTMKTEGIVHERSRRLATKLWLAVIPGFLLINYLTWIVRPEFFLVMQSRPLVWLAGVVCLGSGACLFWGLRKQREKLALLGSTLLILGIIMGGAAALFPIMLYSTLNPADQLTATTCAAPEHSLWIATAWWFPALALSLVYVFIVQSKYSGKVTTKASEGLY